MNNYAFPTNDTPTIIPWVNRYEDMNNLALNVDSYKRDHGNQYPDWAVKLYSYISARGGSYKDKIKGSLYFGPQMFVLQYLINPMTHAKVDRAKEVSLRHDGIFDEPMWRGIVDEFGGYAPVKIKSVPEGTWLPFGVPALTCESCTDDPKYKGIVSHIETGLVRAKWFPSAVATISALCRLNILEALYKSCDDPLGTVDGQMYWEDLVQFKLHDFAYRGVSSQESGWIGGLAHLVSFLGTDTMGAVLAAETLYGTKNAGFSVRAAEHTTMTARGRDGEAEAFRRMLELAEGSRSETNKYPIVAVVSDAYDIYRAVNNIWGEILKKEVMAFGDRGGRLVIRPDSGDPTTVPIDIIEALSKIFGYSVNSKGYKVLPHYIRVIQGDGITVDTIPVILNNLMKRGFSAENIVFGMGGGLLQKVDRDTFGDAQKGSAVYSSEAKRWLDMFKQPVTQPGKGSLRGRFQVNGTLDGWAACNPIDTQVYRDAPDLLRTIYEKGAVSNLETLTPIRERSRKVPKGLIVPQAIAA